MPNKTIKIIILIFVIVVSIIPIIYFMGFLNDVNKAHIYYDQYGGITKSKNGYTATKSYAKWPEDMPTDVPKFNYGTLTQNSRQKDARINAWSVFFDGIAPEVMEKYKSDLINSGWKIKPDKLNFGQPSEHFLAEKTT